VSVRCAEGELERVLAGEELESPLQKAVDGILEGIPLHGADLIRSSCERAADSPDSLRRDDRAPALERLVEETQALVAVELPDLELRLRLPVGARRRPWRVD
jgi:hypothetical protein